MSPKWTVFWSIQRHHVNDIACRVVSLALALDKYSSLNTGRWIDAVDVSHYSSSIGSINYWITSHARFLYSLMVLVSSVLASFFSHRHTQCPGILLHSQESDAVCPSYINESERFVVLLLSTPHYLGRHGLAPACCLVHMSRTCKIPLGSAGRCCYHQLMYHAMSSS